MSTTSVPLKKVNVNYLRILIMKDFITPYKEMNSSVSMNNHPSHNDNNKPESTAPLSDELIIKDKEIEELKVQLSRAMQDNDDTLRDLQFIKERIFHIEKMAGLGKMFVSMANELNNLLSGIIGYTELLSDNSECPAAVKRELEVISRQSHRTYIIIKGLLAFSHLQKIEREPIQINETLEYIVSLKKHYLMFDNIILSLECDRNLPQIIGNSDSLQHLFINLINNAHQALKNHKGERKLIIKTARKKGYVQIVFRDTGPGVPPDLYERLFEPFFSTWGEKESLGLGLATSYGIVSEHGGNLYYDMEQAASGGAVFVVELPVKKQMAKINANNRPLNNIRKQSIELTEDREVTEKNKRILLVDDSDSVLGMLCDALGSEGFDVVSTTSGEKALEMIKAEDYDIIITDMKMPVVSGIHLYSYIENEKAHLLEKIVFITGDIIDSTTRSFLKTIDNPYFTKPFDVRKFVSVIRKII